MTWLIVALVVAGVAAASALLGEQKAPIHVWQQLASRRGGVCFDHATRPALEVNVRDARVRLEINRDASNGPERIICRARYPVPAGPVFRVEAGSVGAVGKLLGSRDVTLDDDRTFDAYFIVDTDQRDVVRRAWSPPAMRIMVRTLRDARVHSDGRTIELVRSAIHSPAIIEAMIDVVGELASADLFGIEALRTLPGATYHPPTGPWNDRTTPRAVIEQPAPVTLMPALVSGRVVTRAAVGDGPRTRRIELRVREDGSIEPTEEPTDDPPELPPEALALLPRLGHGTLVIDGADTSFTWHTVETDPQRLLAGARLLAIVAGGPALGAYR